MSCLSAGLDAEPSTIPCLLSYTEIPERCDGGLGGESGTPLSQGSLASWGVGSKVVEFSSMDKIELEPAEMPTEGWQKQHDASQAVSAILAQ